MTLGESVSKRIRAAGGGVAMRAAVADVLAEAARKVEPMLDDKLQRLAIPAMLRIVARRLREENAKQLGV